MRNPTLIEALKPRTPRFGRRFNPDGNERLTAVIGLILVVLSAIEIFTLLLGLQSTLHLHVFVGPVLLPPIAVKLASTGWRFARYYARNEAYRLKGAPQIFMRLLAPLLVVSTVMLFGSGVALGVPGEARNVASRLHGPAAVVWMVTLGLHVLVYTSRALHAAGSELRAHTRKQVAGAKLRAAVVAAALAGGAFVGLAILPLQHDWLHQHGRHHHLNGRLHR
jgi:hypothetical protein